MKKNEKNQDNKIFNYQEAWKEYKPIWGTLSNRILKKSRQKRWQKYNGLTYSEAVKLLEHWKWHSQKLENLLAKIIKAEKNFKESTDIKTDIDAIEKRTKLIEKAEKILNSDVIWPGGY